MQSGNKINEKNFFFSVDFVEYGAFMVHGFSVEKLKALSRGKRFFDCFDEIEQDFLNAEKIIAHNTSFDFMFLRAEFENANRFFDSSKGFCSMKNSVPICKLSRSNHRGYKYPRLSELCHYLEITDSQILDKTEEIFGENCGYHDARFDTTALFLSVNKLMQENQTFSALKEFL
jgi:DNA polymerase-3 subunit epsilon